jgi:predicted transcriptional regulator
MIFNPNNWYDIPGYNGKYQINTIGQVKSNTAKSKGKLLNITENNGYNRVKLESTIFQLHRIVALTFLQNPNNLEQVNHIDGDKSNNTLENLEWICRSDNQKHAYETRLRTPTKGRKSPQSKTIQKIVDGIVVAKYTSTSNASKELGLSQSLISMIISGKRNQRKEYTLKHKKVDNCIENLPNEIWKPVNKKGFEDYKVSNMGRIIGLDGKLKTLFNKRYLTVRMRDKSFLVHRLVAETFIPTLDESLVVNHEDENKHNACLENLEWVSQSYNVIYSL